MPTELTQEQLAKIHAAIFARRKIEAIKLYRHFSGVGLSEAKDWVEKISAEMETQEPTKFSQKPKGCAAVLLLLVLLAILFCVAIVAKADESRSLPTLDDALAAPRDIWGEASLRETNGP